MDIKESFDELLSRELDRKEFLAYLGGTVLAIAGVSSLLKTVTRDPRFKHQSSGYGSSVYGGQSAGLSSSKAPTTIKQG